MRIVDRTRRIHRPGLASTRSPSRACPRPWRSLPADTGRAAATAAFANAGLIPTPVCRAIRVSTVEAMAGGSERALNEPLGTRVHGRQAQIGRDGRTGRESEGTHASPMQGLSDHRLHRSLEVTSAADRPFGIERSGSVGRVHHRFRRVPKWPQGREGQSPVPGQVALELGAVSLGDRLSDQTDHGGADGLGSACHGRDFTIRRDGRHPAITGTGLERVRTKSTARRRF